MSNLDFLNDAAADFKAPPTLERGQYRFVITGYDGGVMSNEKQSPYVDVTAKAMEVLSGDVDASKLNNYRTIKHRFWMSEKARYMASAFFSDILGLDVMDGKEKKSYSRLFEEAVGRRFVGTVKVTKTTRGEDRAEIERVSPDE